MEQKDLLKGENRFKELGSTGLKESGGYIYEDVVKQLQGRRGIKTYNEMMDNDDTIGASLLAIELLIRQVDWKVQEASQDNADLELKDFVESCMNDMEHTWGDFISEVCSFLGYGWAWHEQVFKKRLGDSNNPIHRSDYNDGKIGWRKFAPRAQTSLDRWEYDRNTGDLLGMHQFDEYRGGMAYIPIEKSLHFTTRKRKNSAEGRSILRNAHRSWYFKKNIQNIEGIGIERDLAGLPVVYMPPEYMLDTANANQKALFKQMKEIVTSIKRDEQEGLIMPLAFDENNNKLFEIGLINSGGSRQFDTTGIIRRYDQSIAVSILTDFMLLGHDNVGSYALAETKTEMFTLSVGAYADAICDVINRQAIPKLCKLNGYKVDKYPQVTRSEVRSVDLKTLGEFISKLSGAGANLFPDNELENYLKRQADLPVTNTDNEGM